MVNIIGLMDAFIKGTLSKAIEMGMEFGNQKIENSNTKATICLIENMDMESMIGEMEMFIKEIIYKTLELVMDNYLKMESSFMKDSGKMDNKYRILRLE